PHGLSHSSAGLYRPCPPLSTCKAKREYGTDGKGRSKRKMTWSWHEYFRLFRFFRLFRTCSSPPISLTSLCQFATAPKPYRAFTILSNQHFPLAAIIVPLLIVEGANLSVWSISNVY